jgi:ribosomal protein S18 acetylase RimI-like enzyme
MARFCLFRVVNARGIADNHAAKSATFRLSEMRLMHEIREIGPSDAQAHVEALERLLRDAVESGASIGFVLPLEESDIRRYWRDVAEAMNAGSRRLLGAFDGGELVGAVQLDLASKANARHRGEVQKLLVHRLARRRGVGGMLMLRVEQLALSLGRTLLILDVRLNDPAQRLYERLGYRHTGVVPRYASDPDGALRDCMFMHKELAP